MAELKKTRDAATYQKLPPPKSLLGDEDAEDTWEMIMKRYPNAAPLLCEMETALDRAENLLRKLRSPITKALDKSSSHSAESEDDSCELETAEESAEVSMLSVAESCKVYEEYHASDDNVSVGVYLTEDQGLNTALDQFPDLSIQEHSPTHSVSNSKPCTEYLAAEDEPSADYEEKSFAGDNNVTSTSKPPQSTSIAKNAIVEAWGKVAGEPIMRNNDSEQTDSLHSSAVEDDAREDSVSEHTRRLAALKCGPMQQITKLKLLGRKDELTQRFARTISTASEVIDTTRKVEQKSAEEGKGKREVKEIPADFRSSPKEIDESANVPVSPISKFLYTDESGEKKDEEKTFHTKIEKESQGFVNESITLGENRRLPVKILQEYAKQCDVEIDYKHEERTKIGSTKNFVIKCYFANGFTVTACGNTRDKAENEAATKMLRLLGVRQMDGEETSIPAPFSKEQMEEIINLGTGGELDNSVRKLYKECIKKQAAEPVYTVQKTDGKVGSQFTAKCEALGKTTSGFGVRDLVAKRVAADELLKIYYENEKVTY